MADPMAAMLLILRACAALVCVTVCSGIVHRCASISHSDTATQALKRCPVAVLGEEMSLDGNARGGESEAWKSTKKQAWKSRKKQAAADPFFFNSTHADNKPRSNWENPGDQTGAMGGCQTAFKSALKCGTSDHCSCTSCKGGTVTTFRYAAFATS